MFFMPIVNWEMKCVFTIGRLMITSAWTTGRGKRKPPFQSGASVWAISTQSRSPSFSSSTSSSAPAFSAASTAPLATRLL